MHRHLTDYLNTVFRLLRSKAAFEAAIVMAGNFSSAGLRFIVSIILADALGPTHWGYLVVFVALTDLVAVYADSGINTTTVRFLAGQASTAPRRLIAVSLVIKLVLVVVITLVCWAIFRPFLVNQGIPVSYAWLFPVACVAGILQSFRSFSMSIFQAHRRFVSYSLHAVLVNVIRICLVAVAIIIAVPQPEGLFAAFYIPIPIAMLLSAVAVFFTFLRAEDREVHTFTAKELLSFLFPLGVLNLVTILLQRIDVFMINAYADATAAGIYGLAYQVAFVFPLISSAVFNSLLPKVSAMREPVALQRYLWNIFKIAPVVVSAAAAGALVLPFIVPPLLGSEYQAAGPLVSLLVIAFGVNMIFNPVGLVFYAVNKPYVLTIIHIVQLPVLIAGNIILIPAFGAAGAVYSGLFIRLLGVAAVVVLALRQTRRGVQAT